MLSQAPAEVVIEPIELAPGSTFRMPAGGTIPESNVTIANGSGQTLTKALLGGQKTPLIVVQRLWRLKDGQGQTLTLEHTPLSSAARAHETCTCWCAMNAPCNRRA